MSEEEEDRDAMALAREAMEGAAIEADVGAIAYGAAMRAVNAAKAAKRAASAAGEAARHAAMAAEEAERLSAEAALAADDVARTIERISSSSIDIEEIEINGPVLIGDDGGDFIGGGGYAPGGTDYMGQGGSQQGPS
jgi:hypothetical protein